MHYRQMLSYQTKGQQVIMSTAVANQEQKPTSIKGWLQSEAMQAEVAKALPKHMRA